MVAGHGFNWSGSKLVTGLTCTSTWLHFRSLSWLAVRRPGRCSSMLIGIRTRNLFISRGKYFTAHGQEYQVAVDKTCDELMRAGMRRVY